MAANNLVGLFTFSSLIVLAMGLGIMSSLTLSSGLSGSPVVSSGESHGLNAKVV